MLGVLRCIMSRLGEGDNYMEFSPLYKVNKPTPMNGDRWPTSVLAGPKSLTAFCKFQNFLNLYSSPPYHSRPYLSRNVLHIMHQTAAEYQSTPKLLSEYPRSQETSLRPHTVLIVLGPARLALQRHSTTIRSRPTSPRTTPRALKDLCDRHIPSVRLPHCFRTSNLILPKSPNIK